MHQLRTFRLRRLFLPLFEGGEKIVGIRFSACHLHKAGIQFLVCLFRLAGTFLLGGILIYTVLDKEVRMNMENVVNGVRGSRNAS